MTPIPLILLHHSGGTARVFDPLLKSLPPEIEPVPLELPGRGGRWREPPLTSAAHAVDDLLDQAAGLRGEIAVLGHSMGAYLGLALAARLENGGHARCRTLFASANAGPFAARPLFATSPSALGDDEILAAAEGFGGMAPEVLAHPGLRERAVSLLRADFGVCDSFVRALSGTVTEARIVVCCGDRDDYTHEQLTAWKSSSTEETEILRFPGGHFYLQTRADELAAAVTARVLDPVS
ncbi:MAG: alpha/beta fold hydrolase [Streptosporangiaceae bacterium]